MDADDGATQVQIKRGNGQLVVQALVHIGRPVSLPNLLHFIAKRTNNTAAQIEHAVSQVLRKGYAYGFIVREHSRYYLTSIGTDGVGHQQQAGDQIAKSQPSAAGASAELGLVNKEAAAAPSVAVLSSATDVRRSDRLRNTAKIAGVLVERPVQYQRRRRRRQGKVLRTA